jgi:hypothetical protein
LIQPAPFGDVSSQESPRILSSSEDVQKTGGAASKSPEPVSFAPITSGFIETISRIPATRYKSKALVLTKDESMQIATALDQVLNVYLPDLENMDPKTAAILGLTITVSSIFVAKIQAFDDEQTQKQILASTAAAV